MSKSDTTQDTALLQRTNSDKWSVYAMQLVEDEMALPSKRDIRQFETANPP